MRAPAQATVLEKAGRLWRAGRHMTIRAVVHRVFSELARSAIPALALAGLLSVLGNSPALAHARYERSVPGDGALVSSPPTRVDIWFIQDLFRRQGENWIHVEDPGGARVEVGEAQVDDDDRRHLWVELQPDLTAGEYHVSWRNLSSEDADSDEGEFNFTYDPQAAVTSTPMLLESPTNPPSANAPPQASEPASPSSTPASQAATAAPTPETGGSGCGLGLLPIAGLVLWVLPVGLKRRSRTP